MEKLRHFKIAMSNPYGECLAEKSLVLKLEVNKKIKWNYLAIPAAKALGVIFAV